MNAITFLRSFGDFYSVERPGYKASGGEIKRWFLNKAVYANGEPLEWNEEMDFPIISFVLFPNNKNKRCTLY